MIKNINIMTTQLFIIKSNEGVHSFYTNINKAKSKLVAIYNETCDYKNYGYKIEVYNLIQDEFIFSNITFTYCCDLFTTYLDPNIKIEVIKKI